MEEYCVNDHNCRRQIFSEKFTDNRTSFSRCISKCDNCKVVNGASRRTFITMPDSMGILRAQELELKSKSSVATKSIPTTKQNETQPQKATFVKASTLTLTSTTSAACKSKRVLVGNSGSLIFNNANKKPITQKVASSHVIDLVDDGEESEWLEPLPKRSKT